MIGAKLGVKPFLEHMAGAIRAIDPNGVRALADAIHAATLSGNMVFVIGNGGSGSNASHFVEDVGKQAMKLPDDLDFDSTKRRVRILSLTDNTAYITAWANDEGFERVFVEQLRNLARPGDLLVAISGSGNSKNILIAVEWATRNGVITFGVTGFTGGKLREMVKSNLHVESDDMGVVETAHLAAFHWVVDEMHRRMSTDWPAA